MKRREDLVDMVFGRLTVVCLKDVTHDRTAIWLCRCECGEELEVSGRNLRRETGATKSCRRCSSEKYRTAIRDGSYARPDKSSKLDAELVSRLRDKYETRPLGPAGLKPQMTLNELKASEGLTVTIQAIWNALNGRTYCGEQEEESGLPVSYCTKGNARKLLVEPEDWMNKLPFRKEGDKIRGQFLHNKNDESERSGWITVSEANRATKFVTTEAGVAELQQKMYMNYLRKKVNAALVVVRVRVRGYGVAIYVRDGFISYNPTEDRRF